MVLRDRSSIFHLSPPGPGLDRVQGGIPDLLTPDDVFEVEVSAMIHDPFGDGTTGFGRIKWKGKGEHTPPPLEHIMSVAIPQQCSLSLGQGQSRLHPISRTFPGKAATIFLAPSTARCLHAPTAGMVGFPLVVPLGRQHLKLSGPGQRLEAMLPVLHEDVKRQLPPLPQEVLVQHRMLSGVPGQALTMEVPPPEEQLEVEMQTPGAPPAPVQGPLSDARGARELA
ncbi:MAG: hypothetical protein M1816_003126 [Peltula sp. TS41687]|nr:MAG: hypothetical protein M1816_003126 [Peltula sp. TS41687]